MTERARPRRDARLQVGDPEAARTEADVPRPRRVDARADRLRRRADPEDGRPERHPARSLHPRDRACDAVRRPLLHVDLGVPADHGTRRRRHRRGREPQRDAEDDPHALAQPRRDLRRRRCSRRSPTRPSWCSRWGSSALVAASIAWGFNRPDVALRHDGRARARSRPARREPRDLRLADGRRSPPSASCSRRSPETAQPRSSAR